MLLGGFGGAGFVLAGSKGVLQRKAALAGGPIGLTGLQLCLESGRFSKRRQTNIGLRQQLLLGLLLGTGFLCGLGLLAGQSQSGCLLGVQGLYQQQSVQCSLCRLDLLGQLLQKGLVTSVAGRLSLGALPQRGKTVAVRLFLRQLFLQVTGLPGGTQGLLCLAQLSFQLGAAVAELCQLHSQTLGETVQQSLSCVRSSQVGKLRDGFVFRVGLRAGDRGQDAPDLLVFQAQFLVHPAALLLQAVLQFLIGLCAEQLAEDLGALGGIGVQQPGKLALGDHGDLAELLVIQPQHGSDGGIYFAGTGHRGTAVRVTKLCVRFFRRVPLGRGFWAAGTPGCGARCIPGPAPQIPALQRSGCPGRHTCCAAWRRPAHRRWSGHTGHR